MANSKYAGALKAWSCVAMLTFFIPAAGFELSTVFFSATADAGHKISRYLNVEDVTSRPLAVSCRGLSGDEMI